MTTTAPTSGRRPQRSMDVGLNHTKELKSYGGDEKKSFDIPGGKCTVKGPAASASRTAGTSGYNVTGSANLGSIECESSFEKGGFKGTVKGTAALGVEATAGTSPGLCVGVPVSMSGSISHRAAPGFELSASGTACIGWPPAARPQ